MRPQTTHTWTEDRHAQCAYLAEILSLDYPLDPPEDDQIRLRAEHSLVRRPIERFELSAQDAADLLEQHVKSRFPEMDEWLVEWRECNGIRGLRVLWAHGPSWLSVRAFCDNYAAVAAPVPARPGSGRYCLWPQAPEERCPTPAHSNRTPRRRRRESRWLRSLSAP